MISFTSEISGFTFRNKNPYKKALRDIAAGEDKVIAELNYIFVDDEALLKINQSYLNHDTYTDIITFDNGEPEDAEIDGDIFISYERVVENAASFNVSVTMELNRVIAHGLLHLCGYKDKTKAESQLMREKEQAAMEILPT